MCRSTTVTVQRTEGQVPTKVLRVRHQNRKPNLGTRRRLRGGHLLLRTGAETDVSSGMFYLTYWVRDEHRSTGRDRSGSESGEYSSLFILLSVPLPLFAVVLPRGSPTRPEGPTVNLDPCP